MTEWSSADCQLWNSLIIKKGMMVRNSFKEQNGKNRYKNLKKKYIYIYIYIVLQQGNILDVNCICGNI